MSIFPTAGHLRELGPDRAAARRERRQEALAARQEGRRLAQAGAGRRARAAARKRGSYYGAQYRRLKARIGDQKAIIAVAASILTAIYHMLRDGTEHADLGAAYLSRREGDSKAIAHQLARRIRALGYQVDLREAACTPTRNLSFWVATAMTQHPSQVCHCVGYCAPLDPTYARPDLPMIIEIGHFALILALGVALVQTALPAWGARVGDAPLMAVGEPAALAQLGLITLSFLALTHAYVTSDFSVETVWANSHSAKPLIYRISGVWGNHEGSMLLWVLILAVFGAAVALFGSNLPATLRANVLAVQAGIAVAFLLFILLASNPFARIPPQAEGRGLNPILQDPALAFHPPFLYAGYVGLSIAFSFAIAALIEGRTDAAWARWVRPWTLAAWICLTLGIAMGSWWAYYELGWGGWWFWDPVENASFMPWLAATALLHSALVMEKREALKVWTILLAILAFSLSLMGTFLVRSGILTSVHAFAVDPRRGVFILAIMIVLIGGALALYAWRAPRLKQGGLFAPISREGALVLNNILLTTGCATVFIGTLYPLALESLTGAKISVGPPYFNLTFVPVMIPLLLAMPLGPYLAWKRGDLPGAMQRLLAAGLVALLCLVVSLALYWRGPWLSPFGIALGGGSLPVLSPNGPRG